MSYDHHLSISPRGMFKFNKYEPMFSVKEYIPKVFFAMVTIGLFSKVAIICQSSTIIDFSSKELPYHFDFNVILQEIVLEIRPRIFKFIISE